MNENCEVCDVLKNTKQEHQLLLTEYWSVGLGNNQAYLGRAYATLRTHKGSLGKLNENEWKEFARLTQKLEAAYKEVLGADPLNWGCFMNNAYREEPDNPHVHWHVVPRYKHAPTFGGITLEDPTYGDHCDPKAERLVDDAFVEQVAIKIKERLDF